MTKYSNEEMTKMEEEIGWFVSPQPHATFERF